MRRVPIELLLTLALLMAAATVRIGDPEPVARLRQLIFDSYLKIAPRVPDPAYPVRIVDIDEASLARVGQWPWPRTHLAEIIERLKAAGAATITLDLVLAESDRLSPGEFAKLFKSDPELAPFAEKVKQLPSNDARLAAVIEGAPVVLGFVAKNEASDLPGKRRASLAFAGDDPHSFVPSFPGAVATLGLLERSAKGLGGVNWVPEHDQIVRRVPLLVSIAGEIYPSLSLEALRLASRETTIFVKSSGGSGLMAFGENTGIEQIRVGKTVLSTDAHGEMWLRFTRPDAGRYIPAHAVLDGSFDAAGVAGRHVLIGSSASGLLDLRATPLAAAVPGVEVHAQALEQMLSGEHLVRPAYAKGAELSFLIVVGALVSALIFVSGPVLAAVVGALSIAGVGLGSWLAYSNGGVLFDPVYPSIAIVLVYLALSLFTYIKSERDRRRVRSAFSHYVAAPLVEELARNHDKLKLGGEMREVTLLFADVRGFSKLSEGMDAEELIRFVNQLFTPLSEIILEKRGTIDKFMGDAVMAFWNAPVTDAEHARNACRAALAMIDDLARFNRERADRARTTAEEAAPVRIGVGLNTGDCCVGNVGSPQRFDYSILGDAVNVAARLEEETKTYGVPIIVGEHTARAAQGFAFLELDSIVPRGKKRAERIFALLGDETAAQSARFRALVEAHSQLLTAMQAQQLAAAARVLKQCRDLGWSELDALFDFYAGRLAKAS